MFLELTSHRSRRITGKRTIRQALASPLLGCSKFTIRPRPLDPERPESALVTEVGMSRGRFVVPALALALVTSLSACATFRTPSISQLQSNPGRYVDKDVTVEGVVTSSWGIPLVPFKAYRVSDGSGEILVLSDNSRTPSERVPMCESVVTSKRSPCSVAARLACTFAKKGLNIAREELYGVPCSEVLASDQHPGGRDSDFVKSSTIPGLWKP